jgi:hypothetical protein
MPLGNCLDCSYCKFDPSLGEDTGLCLYNAPQVSVATSTGYARWPKVRSWNACGQWEKRGTQPDDTFHVDTVVPASVTVTAAAVTVVVNGNMFGSRDRVFLRDSALVETGITTSYSSATQLSAIVPKGQKIGTYSLFVKQDQTNIKSNLVTLTVT